MRTSIVVLALLVGAVPPAARPEPAAAICVAGIEWRGVLYERVQVRRAALPQPGARFGTGRVPGCNDVLSLPPEPDRSTPLRRLGRVPPTLGFFADGAGWAAPGFFPELPGHPLHRALYGSRPGVPNFTRRARCRRLGRYRGRVAGVSAGRGLTIVRGRARRRVKLDALSLVRGFQRAGHPYVQPNDSLELSGWSCASRSEGRYLLARRIRPGR